ncbi:MAG: LEA type 2 family protein [Balneolaceae bacterium]|nr:LEA type 2 family protein [Balneolaceae bacterium]
MKVTLIRILVVIVALFINSCNTLKEIVSAEKPQLSVQDFKIDQLSLSNIDLLFDIKIDNPNPLSVSINNYDYSLVIADQQFVSGTQSLQTTVAASSSNIVQIPVSFGYQELYDTFKQISDQEETEFTFEGMIAVDVPILGLLEIPYSQTGKLPVVKRPGIRVSKMRVKSISISKIALDFDFEIENPNAFDIELSNFSYDLAINRLDAITGSISEQVGIGSKSSNTITIPLEINVLQAGMGFYRAISNKEPIDVNFSGSTTLGTDLPYFKASTFNFDRSGSVDLPD